MFGIITGLNSSRALAASIAGLCLTTSACVAAAGPQPHAGPVIGVIDDVRYEGDQFYVFGWACQQGNRSSIDVHLYAIHAAGAKPAGAYVLAGKADQDNEPAVDRECRDANGGKHRFKIALPNQLLRTFHNKSLYAHGIAVAGNVENAAIAGSGKFRFPGPKWPPAIISLRPRRRQTICSAFPKSISLTRDRKATAWIPTS
jgi:hypothetical protein